MRMSRLIVPVLLMVLPLAALGCRGQATSTPEGGEPTVAPAVAQWPTLTVLSPTVQYREREQDPLADLEPDDTREMQAGSNVVTADGGHAEVAWTDFLTAELLPGTDLLLGLSLPAQREVMMDQATGTARYNLQGAGAPAKVQIKAAWASILLDMGTADVLVSLLPGTEPAVWIASLDGTAKVDRSGETADVGPGQVLAITERGALSEPVDADRAALIAWFEDEAAGRGTGDITVVAFRCTVAGAPATLRAGPDEAAETVGAALPVGRVVAVVDRDADGTWLRVRPVGASEEGWVSSESLACVGPVTLVKVSEAPTEPTGTATKAAPRVVLVTATPLLTPTPTATVTYEYTIKFWAEDDEIEEGKCTVVRWETNNIREVYYQNRGVPGNGSSEECPDGETTYTLRVVLRDGREEKHTVTVGVRAAPEPTEAPPTNTSPPEPPQPAETPAAPTETPSSVGQG
jgi:hypothetical protein